MTLPSVHCALWLAISASLLLVNPVVGQPKPTRQDKSQIIQFILRTYDFTESETWRDTNQNTILLLGEDLSPADIPVRRGVQFKVITHDEVERLRKAGVEYYEFRPFEVTKTAVRVSFIRTYVSGKEANGSAMEYTCRKIAGRWKLKARLDGVYAS